VRDGAGRGVVGLLTLSLIALSGCASDAAYLQLQEAMKRHITRQDRRPVDSVSCAPHVHGTEREERAHLRCLVRFEDGSSYTANAYIQNENFGGAHNLPDTYTWDAPPPRR
jgi:hypothetical protein